MNSLPELADKSVAKDLADLSQPVRSLDVLSKAERERVARFVQRLHTIGQAEIDKWELGSAIAEEVYCIHQEQDFILFKGPDGEPLTWLEVRERLAGVLKLSPATLSHYIRLVRIGREVLGFDDGDFTSERGIVTVNHIAAVVKGCDGRTSEDFAVTVAPLTEEFKDYLEERLPGGSYVDQLRRYYHDEVRWELQDDDAINKPPKELAAQARDRIGAPSFKTKRVYDKAGVLRGYQISFGVNDQMETYTLKFEEQYIPQAVRDWLDNVLLRAK